MSNSDQKLTCRDCGKEFNFTPGEQQFFASRGFNPPTRCSDCRKKKKQFQDKKPSSTFQESNGNVFEIKCSKCGKTTQVPFRPRNPEGVLCAECFGQK